MFTCHNNLDEQNSMIQVTNECIGCIKSKHYLIQFLLKLLHLMTTN